MKHDQSHALRRLTLRATPRALALIALLTAVAAPAAADPKAEAAAESQPSPVHAEGEESEGIEHTLIVGVGGAAELELGDRSMHPGVNGMVEWDAIENWLEFEVSASLLSSDSGVEVPFDLLIKKPFRLTRRLEFMIGVGPEVVQVVGGGSKGTYFGGEAALDFMFWPSRRLGVWVEPSFDFLFRDGASVGLGGTGGLLVGW